MECESTAIIQVIINALTLSSHHTTRAMLQGIQFGTGKLQEDLPPENMPKWKYLSAVAPQGSL